MNKYYSEESIEKLLKTHGIIQEILSSVEPTNPLKELSVQELVDEISHREEEAGLSSPFNVLKVKSTKELLKELSRRNFKLLKENDIKDLEEKLIKKIVPQIGYTDVNIHFAGRNSMTFASVAYMDKNCNIRTKCGVSKKRKGDVYNKELGQLMALIDAI